jgi:hypothetical protein
LLMLMQLGILGNGIDVASACWCRCLYLR